MQTEKQIQEHIQELASTLSTLSEQNIVTARALLNRMTRAANKAEQSIGQSTTKASNSAVALGKAAKRLEQLNHRNRLTVLVSISLTGFVLGSLSLLMLLIWQPQFLQSLYRVATALGMTP